MSTTQGSTGSNGCLPKSSSLEQPGLSEQDSKEIKISNSAKWFRVRVTDLKTGKSKSNVKIPVRLANFGMKMAAKNAPESIEGLDWNQLIAAAQNGGEAKMETNIQPSYEEARDEHENLAQIL